MPALRSYIALRPIRNSQATILRWEGLGLLLAKDLRQAREMATKRWNIPHVVRATFGINPRIKHLWAAYQEAGQKDLALPLPDLFLTLSESFRSAFPDLPHIFAAFRKTSDSRFVQDRHTGEVVSEEEAICRMVSDIQLQSAISILSEYDYANADSL